MKKEYTIQNASGLAGMFHIDQAAGSLYYLLHAMQHRGSDGAGIACSNGEHIAAHKGLGMLSEVFAKNALDELKGSIAVGHIRMKTPGDLQSENLQPIMVRAHQGSFAVVFCGMITNGLSLKNAMEAEGLIYRGTSGAEIVAHLIQKGSGSLQEKIMHACSLIEGAYTFLLMTKNTMYAVRSPDGIRSLYMARTKERGYIFSSESSAFGILMPEITEIREVKPGEMIALGKNGYHSHSIGTPNLHACSMEAVYYSRPDAHINGKSIHQARQEAGRLLALKEDVDADIVIGVPDTAMSAAAAFARQLGKPYEIGLIKNRYIGSTFIQPTKAQRDAGMRVRLNAISSIVKGKRVYLIDDSIQKGDTARRISRLLKEAGAKEVHLRIASPIMKYSCIYGTEYFPKKTLAGALYTVEEMQELFGCDSLKFLSLEEFQSSLPEGICTACFNGEYPVAVNDYKSLCMETE